jgi:pilus assembly protein CpaF
MVLMSGFDFPMRAVRSQMSSALDLIIHLERMSDGSRKVTAITEVQRMESEIVTLQDLFDFRAGPSGHALQATGLRPTFMDKFEQRSIALPAWMLASNPTSLSGDYARVTGR